MNQISVNIKLLSPMVLSASNNTTVMTESLNHFSGTALRGILAERYILCNKLGKFAHEDEKFLRLFFNKLRFIAANPIDTKTRQRSFVLPLSIQKEKSGLKHDDNCTLIQDLMCEKSPKLGYKGLRGYGVADGEILYTIGINKNIHLHMSRGSGDERLLGSSRDGNIYNYESIDAGQEFQGLIFGEIEDIETLLNALKLKDETFITYAGRSKYTQYGKCQITFDKIKAVPKVEEILENNSVCLRFDTPYIPKPGLYRNVEEQLQEIVKIVDTNRSNRFRIDDIYAEQIEIENFIGIWRMKRPCAQALSAGTIFRLIKDSAWTEDELFRLNQLLCEGCGMRREEGFGHLQIWSLKINKTKDSCDSDYAENLVIPDDVKEIVKKIIKERILNQLRIYAAEDANNLRGIGQNTHFFAELDDILQQARLQSISGEKGISETLKFILQESPQNEKGRPFNDHMTRTYINGNNFEDILVNNLIAPYKNRDWQEDIGGSDQLQKLFEKINLNLLEIDIIDGEYFYEYWHWLFREARRRASINKEVA